MLAPLQDQDTADCVRAERALNARLEGGCQVPIACHAVLSDPDQLYLRGLVGLSDGSEILRAEMTASRQDPEALGVAVAEDLLSQGAAEILAAAYG